MQRELLIPNSRTAPMPRPLAKGVLGDFLGRIHPTSNITGRNLKHIALRQVGCYSLSTYRLCMTDILKRVGR